MRISTPAAEGQFQAAKWIKIQALVDATELSQLFLAMEPFTIYPLAGALPLEAFPLKKEAYLLAYESWIAALKRGEAPSGFGSLNATMWTRSSEALWLQELPGKRYIARPKEPFLQVQVHHMGYSFADKTFRPMSLTQDALFWGLQFSFPQVFDDPVLGMLDRNLPHADLFQVVRKWSREYTVATPMLVFRDKNSWSNFQRQSCRKSIIGGGGSIEAIQPPPPDNRFAALSRGNYLKNFCHGTLVDGKRENLPMRIGKQCFSWVNNHPGLKEKDLAVLEIL